VADYRAGLAEARVHPMVDLDELRAVFNRPLPEDPVDARTVMDELQQAARPGLVATAGPRFFGFVIGGSVDAAMCADLLATGWDQVGFNAVSSPAAAVAEEAAGVWLKDLLGIPENATVGFTTGGQAANTVGLLAARQYVLRNAGWDVERDGLIGAPRVRVLAGAERHGTLDRALRFVGLGAGAVVEVPADGNGAMRADAVAAAVAEDGDVPTIVCAQSGNVNSGACDDLRTICEAARSAGAWVHVDGAFGLWAASSPSTRHLVDGIELADSWACDGHKWLNVPYDSGFAFCAHPEVHRNAMSYTAAYLTGQSLTGVPGPSDLVFESSRRARGFAVWAALQSLGRSGVADLVDRCCALARRFAKQLDAIDGFEVVNDVVLNQVLVRFGDAAETDRVIDAVQREGTCWFGGTTWHGMRLARISVSNWSTTEEDVDRSVDAVVRMAQSPSG
jgi:glutamate/tyrosine decarboxylase-like PLP-dependent enzyme